MSRAKVFGVAGFERQFAVKRFHPELTATAAMAAGLSAAARAYGSLEHPRIARMSEFGVAQGATFTAVEYVPGLDALRLIAEVRLASGSGAGLAAGGALALVSQAARAVGYAHGRGLTHLGLAPTNVIVTADGDIKITDFGILSATLPQRPIDVPRVAQRVPYLAPEQLANEATSAATDVFALGVLAYELVTGARTFKGDTPQQVAHAIMTGPPPEPPLPRPIVRVLQRCLARSPFERFPDARALADALDAALRVAPVPGTRKDIGAQVKDTLDRLAALNEGQMSGVVALHLGTGPIRRLDDGDARRAPPAIGRDPDTAHDLASAPYELAPPDPMSPQALAAAGATISDLPRPMTTVPGLPPPPIPVPPGVGPPTVPMAPGPAGTGTLLGMGKSPPAPPAGKSQPGSQAGAPPVPGGVRRPPTRPGFDLEIPVEPTLPRPEMSTESAVHPLDPSELEPFDPDAPDEGDAEYDADPDAAPSRAPSAADEFLDAPTRSVGDAVPGNPRPSRPALPTTYRLDPSSIDTRPIEPITLGPLLDDPDMRPSATPSTRPSSPPAARSITRPITRPALLSESDEAWSLDEDQALDDLAAGRVPTVPATTDSSAAAPGANRASTPGNPGSSASRLPTPPGNPGSGASRLPTPPGNPGSGLSRLPGPDSSGSGLSRLPASPDGSGSGLSRLPAPAHEAAAADAPQSRTILGFAAPPSAPRTTPSPFPPSPSFAPDPGPTADPRAREDEPGPPLRWPEEASAALPAPSYPGVPEQVSPQPPPGWITAPAVPTPPIPAPASARPRRGAAWIPAGVLGAVLVGLGAWQVYTRGFVPHHGSSGPTTAVPGDAAVAHAPADAQAIAHAPADAAQVAA
ncbi:MAG TPA: protein kinase, partial [Kofleriaceae bacterium]